MRGAVSPERERAAGRRVRRPRCSVRSYRSWSSLRNARGKQVGEIGWDGSLGHGTLGLGPDRIRKMRVVGEARHDVPVQMRDEIAEARHIHLLGRNQRAKRGLDAKYDP